MTEYYTSTAIRIQFDEAIMSRTHLVLTAKHLSEILERQLDGFIWLDRD